MRTDGTWVTAAGAPSGAASFNFYKALELTREFQAPRATRIPDVHAGSELERTGSTLCGGNAAQHLGLWLGLNRGGGVGGGSSSGSTE